MTPRTVTREGRKGRTEERYDANEGRGTMTNELWTDEQRQRLETAVSDAVGKRGALIGVLQQAQDIFGYLSRETMNFIAEGLGIAPSEVFGVATFYAQFSFEPRGRHTLLSCQGTACHVRGGDKILGEILRELDVQEGSTTDDGRFTVESVYCIGCCSLAPAIIIDDKVHAKLTAKKTKELLAEYS